MWSLILYVVCVGVCMYVYVYVVFYKIDHCIHIHWCIVMGLGHNDPWVESHMWPQQTWGQRSSRGQWFLVQVFGKKDQCIHILWCIFKSNITMIAKVCDRESRRDTWFENRLVEILLHVFKFIQHMSPNYMLMISDYFTIHVPACTLRSSCDSNRLTIPRLGNSITGDKRFHIAAAKAWNSLPVDIKSATTTSQFKSMLKTHLFSWTILLLYAFCVYFVFYCKLHGILWWMAPLNACKCISPDHPWFCLGVINFQLEF